MIPVDVPVLGPYRKSPMSECFTFLGIAAQVCGDVSSLLLHLDISYYSFGPYAVRPLPIHLRS
jgi:hypothetical protein